MRSVVKISILIIGLIVGNIGSSALSLTVENGCEFYDAKTASTPNIGLQALFNELQESSSVIVCNGERQVDFSILEPIHNRNGVSFYKRCYHEIPADRFSKAKSAKDLLSTRRHLELTMMALDPNSDLTHRSEAVVTTDALSPGAFKTLYNVWMKSIEDSEKLKEHLDTAALDAEGKARYGKFINSLKNSTETKITYLQFQDLRMAEGDGIDLEFFPRLVVNISTKKQWWEIDFDVLDGDRYLLLNVELRMDATDAN
ncbi:hypothetical protein [Hyphococcus sp.]|uniref:hypothetical protein n=1 Tax=Hyphococcus sp. TaxID=2038636 RepID=UPI003CCBD0A8